MKKIYIVTSGEYSDFHIDKVFSTKKLAHKFIGNGGEQFSIETWDVDKKSEGKIRQIFEIWIRLDNGELFHEGNSFLLDEDNKRACWTGITSQHAQGHSFVSSEHAHKLAVEARQKWLRERYERGEPLKQL